MAPKPTPEFCAEAVRVALTSGLPRKQVAADFEREVADLRKENRMLWEERDVLKKAKVFFAERSK